jgi:hypothetical protein
MTKQTPARMTRLVAQWRASGESRAGFARRHHIPAWTFWYWCRKLSAEPRSAAGDMPPAEMEARRRNEEILRRETLKLEQQSSGFDLTGTWAMDGDPTFRWTVSQTGSQVSGQLSQANCVTYPDSSHPQDLLLTAPAAAPAPSPAIGSHSRGDWCKMAPCRYARATGL